MGQPYKCEVFALASRTEPRFSNPFYTLKLRLQRHWSSKLANQRQQYQVQLAGTSFCLDAGSGQWHESHNFRHLASILTTNFVLVPANNVPMKIWKYFDNLPAQAWFYTADVRIVLTGTGKCLVLSSLYPLLPP